MPIESINHAHHDDRFHMSRPYGKRDRQRKNRLLDSHSGRMPLGGRLPAVPNGAGIVKSLKWAVTILDGIVQQPVSTNRVQVVLVPAAQVIAIPRHEAVEQRSPPAD